MDALETLGDLELLLLDEEKVRKVLGPRDGIAVGLEEADAAWVNDGLMITDKIDGSEVNRISLGISEDKGTLVNEFGDIIAEKIIEK
eukprot:CAMPEP_0170118664 /NCGR_PEP_ID=MMETSP0020_2-20130122/13861_1 /TAXON_ID=98059 /ORGANISM="Dinobryon sp., Strain UTEXLB2267" /LENGTH=86 /DNA_ID=CAMNT_0010347739 /DNA_START=737 /DNA_END=994 /DNA_ORIENTATION=+